MQTQVHRWFKCRLQTFIVSSTVIPKPTLASVFNKYGFIILSWVTVNKQYRNDDPVLIPPPSMQTQMCNTEHSHHCIWTLAWQCKPLVLTVHLREMKHILREMRRVLRETRLVSRDTRHILQEVVTYIWALYCQSSRVLSIIPWVMPKSIILFYKHNLTDPILESVLCSATLLVVISSSGTRF